MGRLGTGHYAGRRWSQFLDNDRSLPQITPSATWDGTPGTGFSVVPSDPLRVTAKPGLRMIVPPKQHFTQSLAVGAIAFANDGGSLIGGIDRVRFHFEGETIDVVEPSYWPVRTAAGSLREYFGYWVELSRPLGVTGEGHLYVEAIPADASIQSRVIGPFSFSPTDVLHDFDLTVAPSQPELVGASYQTLMGAIQYCKSVSAQNPRVTIVEGGLYDMPIQAPVYSGGTGRLLVEATTPITIGYPAYTNDITALMRPRYDGIHFRGSNITFDMRFVTSISHENQGEPYWFDGINLEISGDPQDALWRNGPRPVALVAEGASYWTECNLRNANDILNGASLARGNFLASGYRDVATRSLCLINNTVADWDSGVIWARDVPAMTVNGPAGAMLSISGANDAGNRTLTAGEGGSVISTFKVGKTEAYFLGAKGDGYTIQNVVDWINGLAGWSATTLDDSRRASALALPNTKGVAFSSVDVSAGVTFVTYFDQHGDFYQHPIGGPGENVVVMGTRLANSQLQDIFLVRDDPKDFFFVNNAFSNTAGANKSQLATAHSHVVLAHNTLANQDMTINPDYVGDSLCLIANNSLQALSSVSASPPAMVNNAIDAGGTPPAEAIGTIVAGTSASKLVDAVAGDFTPAGELLSQLRIPVFSFNTAIGQNGNPVPVALATN